MPVKVLFISSNPRGAPRLDLDEEHRVLEEANARNGRPFDHRAVLAARIEDLPPILREHPPEIVHIAGHGQRGKGRGTAREARAPVNPMPTQRDVDVPGLGGADGSGGLLLRTADGSPELLPSQALTALFELLRDTVRLVVLNACYSDAIAEAILPHAGCVIGSRFAISDAAAIAFARGFYSALGGGHSVRRSFEWGRWESGLRDLDGADTLVLRHRGDVDPDQRVLVRRGGMPASRDPVGRAGDPGPPVAPRVSLARLLEALPVTQSFEGRCELLEGLRLSVQRSQSNRLLDLQMIVNQLRKHRLADGRPSLLVVIDNALGFAEGTEIEGALREERRALEQEP